MPTVQRIWQQACENLQLKLNKDTYERWIADIVPLRMEKDIVYLGVYGNVFGEWLTQNYKDLIASVLTDVMGETMKVAFEVSSEALPVVKAVADAVPQGESAKNGGETAVPSVPKRAESGSPPKPTLEEIRGDQRYTFDNFVVGDSNKFAHSACVAVAKKPGISYNPLFIYGPTGVGKTHLLKAIAHDVLNRKKNLCVEFISSEEFSNEYIDGIRGNQIPKFRKKYRKVDVLLIDDIHFLANKEGLQEEFFHTFNALYNDHKQIVLISDREPKNIAGLEKRLVSRFEWGLQIDIKPPNLETRIAILRKKQEEHGMKLDDDVLTLVAERIRSNVRRLEGALTKLISYASVTGEKMNRAKAEELLRSNLEEENIKPTTIDEIKKAVADHYDIRLSDMTSKARPANIVMPRQVAMYLTRRLTQLSSPAIAEAFSRNHATVLHAVSAIGKKMESCADFRREVEMLERRICGAQGQQG
jgi:chromosomal replication initiator protein